MKEGLVAFKTVKIVGLLFPKDFLLKGRPPFCNVLLSSGFFASTTLASHAGVFRGARGEG